MPIVNRSQPGLRPERRLARIRLPGSPRHALAVLVIGLVLLGVAPAAPAAAWRGVAPAATLVAGPPGSSVVGSRAAAARRWLAPVTPVRVIRAFNPPEHPWLPGHRGIDLRASPGQRVRAAGAGRITYAGALAGRGVVVVDHGVLRTTYEPVDASVTIGEHVGFGETLGVVGPGSGHCGSGHCLHLGLKRGSTYLNPLLLLGDTRTRLVPW